MNISRIKYALLTLVVLILSVTHVSAQIKWNSAYQAYIDQYKDLAIDERGECFRAYDNPRQSFEDHSRFLATQSRYARLFNYSRTDYKSWARGLKQCGYATNPQYASKLIQIIELYNLNQYDKAKKFDQFMVKHSTEDGVAPDGYFHVIKAYNKNYYVIARKGDSFQSLSKELCIGKRKLAKYNERSYKEELAAGDVIYLKKKRKKATKEYKNRPHIVQIGESMYLISQKYGIRLSSLYKKNHLSPDYQIKVGDKLRVY